MLCVVMLLQLFAISIFFIVWWFFPPKLFLNLTQCFWLCYQGREVKELKKINCGGMKLAIRRLVFVACLRAVQTGVRCWACWAQSSWMSFRWVAECARWFNEQGEESARGRDMPHFLGPLEKVRLGAGSKLFSSACRTIFLSQWQNELPLKSWSWVTALWN